MARKQSNPANSNKPFPAALRTLMEERNTSQKDLADYLGKTRQAISLYCNGESAPDLDALVKIAQYFDTSTDYLLGLYPYPHKELSAVDELGFSPATIQAIKRIKEESEEELNDSISELDAAGQMADFNSCRLAHGALDRLISSTLTDSIIYTQMSILANRIEKMATAKIPDHLAAHPVLRDRLGGTADDISAAIKLEFELYNQYPEWAGLLHVRFGAKSLKLDIDDICDELRWHIEEITGYRAFMDSWNSKGGNSHGNK